MPAPPLRPVGSLAESSARFAGLPLTPEPLALQPVALQPVAALPSERLPAKVLPMPATNSLLLAAVLSGKAAITAARGGGLALAWAWTWAWLAWSVPSALAQTSNSYPMLMSVKPSAAQIGGSTDCLVSARYNLYGAQRVLVSGAGVTGEVLPFDPPKAGDKKPTSTTARLRFTVAPDATPGVRDFRLLTPLGATTVGQLVITRDPIVAEAPDNDLPAKAQVVSLPATLCGTIEKAEDLDFYRFHLDAPGGVVFSVRSQRLLNRLHDMQTRVDPLITLRSATGQVLATSDNHYAGDPLLFHQFAEAGDYLLEVRDVRYLGNADWTYTVEAHQRPFVTQVSPLVVTPGQPNRLQLVGFNLPADAAIDWTPPADLPPGWHTLAPTLGPAPLNDVAVLVSPLARQIEGDQPNQELAQAQPVTLPTVLAGTIETEADLDLFRFAARKGQKLSFRAAARAGWSAIDPYLRILNEQGAVVAEADDSTFQRVQSADAWLENWNVPADGNYILEIRDLHLRGGPQFTYAVEVTESQPYFLLEIDTDKTLLSPGTHGVFYVRVVRKNGFTAPIELAVEGLPEGVTATCGRILEGANDGCVILHAAANAPLGGANIAVRGTGTLTPPQGEPITHTARAQPLQEYYSPGGGRGNYPVELHTVSVADPMDVVSITLSTADVQLQPGSSQKIEVTIERAPGFTGNVTLDVIYQHLETPYGNSLPKGVTLDGANSKTLLTGAETRGFITLKAAADAPEVQRQLVPVMAHMSINFVMKLTRTAEPVFISVRK